ncbi:MAG: alpha/beta fold hydrolase [Betaproteobacteria bacterium]
MLVPSRHSAGIHDHRPIRARSRRGRGNGQQRFEKDKVVLLGHSWGTVLGTIYAFLHPEKISAYVDIAQFADVPHGRRLSYAFSVAEARKRRNSKAISELRIIGRPHMLQWTKCDNRQVGRAVRRRVPR